MNAEEVNDKCLAKQSLIPWGSWEQESSVDKAKHWYWKVFNVITVYQKPMQLLLKFNDLLRSLSPMNTAGRTTKYKNERAEAVVLDNGSLIMYMYSVL